jgi:hypothetical protein
MTKVSLVAVVLAGASIVSAQVPASMSAPKAKELASLMKAKKLEAFAMRESVLENRFLAVTVSPDVQTLAVSALYSRPTDIEYWIYQKDYAHAYGDLVSGMMASDRFFVEDILGDGLVGVPAKPGVADTVTMAGMKALLEGPADPKKRNDKRMALEPYTKIFTDADKKYCSLLDSVIAELKKLPVDSVAPATSVR